jgi:hypothetical protein
MNELTRTPDVIATEINTIKEHARNTVLQDSVQIGKKLMEAKQLVPFGQWGQWLQDNVDYSERTAQNLMGLWAEYGLKGAAEVLEKLTLSKAVALLGLPKGERDDLLQENDVEQMSTRELEDMVRELNAEREKNKDQQLTIESLETQLGKERKTAGEAGDLKTKLAAERKRAEEAVASFRDSEKKITELEKELQESSTPEIIEKVPDGIAQELHILREKIRLAPNAPVIKFRAIYEQLQADLEKLSSLLIDIQAEDPAAADKYRNALRTVCTSVANSLI